MVKAITVKEVEGKPGQVYYPLELREIEQSSFSPGENDVVLKMHSAALNHRDVFIRQKLYPGVAFDVPLLADGCGSVVQTGSNVKKFTKGKRVMLNPGQGWDSDPIAPEKQVYTVLGGTSLIELGTLQELVKVSADEVAEVPDHLSDSEAAALPLAGLTAWRALVTKSGNASEGKNILIPGIGGGVAIFLLQFAVALGCNVYVTSSSDEKLSRAKELGAKGGVNYKQDKWEDELGKLLPADRRFLDAVIDGSGDDIVKRATKILKHGGVVVSYGMTVKPQTTFPMSAVMKNIDIRGTTMGSRKEFLDMVEFVGEQKIRPVVHRVAQGGIEDVSGIDGLFDEMRHGKQFGKLVIQINNNDDSHKL